jgi:hypothetical protein
MHASHSYGPLAQRPRVESLEVGARLPYVVVLTYDHACSHVFICDFEPRGVASESVTVSLGVT